VIAVENAGLAEVVSVGAACAAVAMQMLAVSANKAARRYGVTHPEDEHLASVRRRDVAAHMTNVTRVSVTTCTCAGCNCAGK
jgi:hypothetical protein